jgi:hypothetical protein
MVGRFSTNLRPFDSFLSLPSSRRAAISQKRIGLSR